jgi:hypothetical protein
MNQTTFNPYYRQIPVGPPQPDPWIVRSFIERYSNASYVSGFAAGFALGSAVTALVFMVMKS